MTKIGLMYQNFWRMSRDFVTREDSPSPAQSFVASLIDAIQVSHASVALTCKSQ